jgi:hypothetical protein
MLNAIEVIEVTAMENQIHVYVSLETSEILAC